MKALPWPKSMNWGSGTMPWVRPLQCIVALFDGKVLAGEVAPGGAMAPIRFGDTTRGHRFLEQGDDQGRGLRRLRGQAARRRTSSSIRPSARRSSSTAREKLCAERRSR